jgi:hypothetical protein
VRESRLFVIAVWERNNLADVTSITATDKKVLQEQACRSSTVQTQSRY